MITIRRSGDRGAADHGWLDSRFTFSFAEYEDPAHMGFRTLRVINEDRIAPGTGFDTHPHRDMEILTWVLEGAIEHRDSMGHAQVLRPGEIQHMTAGTGIRHSEHNPSPDEPLHLLQIWILPERRGLTPSYEQKAFPGTGLTLLASRDERSGSVPIRQDADVWVARLPAGGTADLPLRPGRHAWVQVARGSVALNGEALSQGDGASLSGEKAVSLRAKGDAEVLVFDLA